jgi:hypothetical protein
MDELLFNDDDPDEIDFEDMIFLDYIEYRGVKYYDKELPPGVL